MSSAATKPNARPSANATTEFDLSDKVRVKIGGSACEHNQIVEKEGRPNGGFSNNAAGKKDALAERAKSSMKKRKPFTKEEIDAIVKLYKKFGAKWTQIREAMPGHFPKRSSRVLQSRYERHVLESLKKSGKEVTKVRAKNATNATKGRKRKNSGEYDSDPDVEEVITNKSTAASREERAKKRQADKENLQNMTEELAA